MRVALVVLVEREALDAGAMILSNCDDRAQYGSGPCVQPRMRQTRPFYMEARIISCGSDPAAPPRRLRWALPARPDFRERGTRKAARERPGPTALPRPASWPRAPRSRIPTDRTA